MEVHEAPCGNLEWFQDWEWMSWGQVASIVRSNYFDLMEAYHWRDELTSVTFVVLSSQVNCCYYIQMWTIEWQMLMNNLPETKAEKLNWLQFGF